MLVNLTVFNKTLMLIQAGRIVHRMANPGVGLEPVESSKPLQSASSTPMPSYNLRSMKERTQRRGSGLSCANLQTQTMYMDCNTPLELLSELSSASDGSDDEWEEESSDSDVDHDRGAEEDDDDEGWIDDCEGLIEDELRELAKE